MKARQARKIIKNLDAGYCYNGRTKHRVEAWGRRHNKRHQDLFISMAQAALQAASDFEKLWH